MGSNPEQFQPLTGLFTGLLDHSDNDGITFRLTHHDQDVQSGPETCPHPRSRPERHGTKEGSGSAEALTPSENKTNKLAKQILASCFVASWLQEVLAITAPEGVSH